MMGADRTVKDDPITEVFFSCGSSIPLQQG
jgi:hypothetical protein